jgi:hypothetical protein
MAAAGVSMDVIKAARRRWRRLRRQSPARRNAGLAKRALTASRRAVSRISLTGNRINFDQVFAGDLRPKLVPNLALYCRSWPGFARVLRIVSKRDCLSPRHKIKPRQPEG